MRSLHMAAASFMTKYGHEGLSGILLWFSSYWAQTFLHTALISLWLWSSGVLKKQLVKCPNWGWNGNKVHDLITGAKIVVNQYLLLEILSFVSTEEDGATRKHHALIQNVPKTSCTTSLFDFKLKKAASFFLFFLKGVVNNNQHNLCSSWITSS